jgi:membrane protein required for colicin V production
MNVFDIIIASLLLFGFVRGLMKGLFVEVASLVALVAGVYGAIHFSYYLGDVLKSSLDWSEQYITLAAFAGTFVIIIVVIALLGKILTKIADFAALGILNKILGGVFGALKIGLILSVVFLFFGRMNDFIPFVKKEQLEKSLLYEPVKQIAPMLFPSIIKSDQEDLDSESILKDIEIKKSDE